MVIVLHAIHITLTSHLPGVAVSDVTLQNSQIGVFQMAILHIHQSIILFVEPVISNMVQVEHKNLVIQTVEELQLKLHLIQAGWQEEMDRILILQY